jgi:hypothetical protein
MTVQTMLEWLRKRPFQPFRLVMADGLAYEVHQRDMAFLTQSDILVGIDKTGEGIADEVKICSLLQVAAIEPLNAPAGYP